MSGSLATIDTSIYSQRPPPPPNPLDTIGKITEIQNARNRNALFPGQMELQRQNIAQQKQSTANTQRSSAFGILAPLLSMDPKLATRSLATTLLADGENNGFVTAGPTSVLANYHGGDGAELVQYLRPYVASQAQTDAANRVAVGAQGNGPMVQYGGAGTGLPPMVQPTTVGGPGSMNPGVTKRAGEPFPVGLTPGEAATRIVVGYDQAGNPIYAPTGTQPTGSPAFGGSNGRYQATPTAPGVPELRNPAAAPSGASPTSMPAPAGAPPGAVVHPGPATEAAQQGRGTLSANRFQAVADEGVQAKEQDAVLANMQNDLQEFASGKGAHGYAELKKLIQGWVPGMSGAFKTQLATQESFDKLTNQLTAAAAPGSDARQVVIQGATPSSAQTPEGVDFILRQLRGVVDYKQARANMAAAAADRADYPAWQRDVASKLNPQVFQYARLTPEQKTTFFNNIPKGKERDAFKRDYAAAQAAGFYGVSNGSQ